MSPPASPVNAATGSELLRNLAPSAGVAIIRLRSLGDTVLTTPALRALKAWRPDLRLAVLIEPRFAPVLDGNPDIDEIIAVPGSIAGRGRVLAALRRFHPALTASLHGGSTAAWLTRFSGAGERATFLGLRHPWAYNRLTPPKAPPPGRAKLHTVEHIASLFEALGMPEVTIGPARLFPQPPVRERMRARLRAAGVEGRCAFLNIEAREPGMRWPRERFVELAAWLRERYGLAGVAASADPNAVAPAGIAMVAGTSVAELISLIADAEMLIGNDGGPVHIAAALSKPVVGLYSSTELEIWSPWRTRCRCLQAASIGQTTAAAVEAAVGELRPS